jgi:phospholipid-binding lipoprotein MlaA
LKKIIFTFILLFNIVVASDEVITNDFSDEFTEQKVEVFDPLSGYNRVMTSFNDKAYVYFLNPVAEGYATVVPEVARIGVSNFFDNILFPIRFVNNLLQFKFKNSVEELGRFLMNSTFGILGLMDPATEQLGWEKHNEDFGQTLGFYGVGSGFHIVLPLLGPSNLRDSVALVADGYVSPINYFGNSDLNYKIPNNDEQTIYIATGKVINRTSLTLGQYESLKKDALDLYPFLRDIYEQKREKEIKE